ncbi:MAG: hypothetical protein ACE5QF_05845 [Thermoplasmata archaeon]
MILTFDASGVPDCQLGLGTVLSGYFGLSVIDEPLIGLVGDGYRAA